MMCLLYLPIWGLIFMMFFPNVVFKKNMIKLPLIALSMYPLSLKYVYVKETVCMLLQYDDTYKFSGDYLLMMN